MTEELDHLTFTQTEDGGYSVTTNFDGYYHGPSGIHYFEAGTEIAVVDEPEDAMIDYLGENPSDFLND